MNAIQQQILTSLIVNCGLTNVTLSCINDLTISKGTTTLIIDRDGDVLVDEFYREQRLVAYDKISYGELCKLLR